MRILLIHQFYLADGEAGGSRFNDMCKSWATDGHKVTVIADATHYQSGTEGAKDRIEDNIDVIRVRTRSYKGHARNARIRSYGQFAIRASRVVNRLQERHDIVIASSPSLPVVIPAFAAKRKWDIPFVFEVRDLWPESAISTGVIRASSFIAQSGYALEELAYEVCDHVVALSPGIAKEVRERNPGKGVSLIPNGVHPDALVRFNRDEMRAELGWTDEEFVMVYVGAHGVANCLSVMIEAATLLRNEPQYKFVAIGDGPMKVQWVKETQRRGLKNITWKDAIPKKDTFKIVGASDAGLAILQRNETFRKVYPNKIFDYMSMNLPTICAIAGDARNLVERHNAGMFVQPEHAQGIADAARQLSQSMESYYHLRDVVLTEFNRERLAHEYFNLLKTLIN